MPSFADVVFAESRARTAGFRNGYRCGYRNAAWESYAPNIAAAAEREATEAATPSAASSPLALLDVVQGERWHE